MNDKKSKNSWDIYFIKMAVFVSTKSKDPSTKHGCVIVGPNNEVRSTGYNGFPRGIDDSEERYNNREEKYKLVEHSEKNAIYNAARNGISLEGCTLYVTGWPCNDCARAIIQSGISRVVMKDASEEFNERWKESINYTKLMFNECNLEYYIIEV